MSANMSAVAASPVGPESSNTCPATQLQFLRAEDHPDWARYLKNNADGPSDVYFISQCDKVSSREVRQPRLVIVSFRKLIMIDRKQGEDGSIKRYTSMSHVQKLTRKRASVKGRSVEQVLINIPTETDMLLEFAANPRNSTAASLAEKFCTIIAKIREVHVGDSMFSSAHSLVSRKQKWNGVEDARGSTNLFSKARLSRSQVRGYQSPAERFHSYKSSPSASAKKATPLRLGPGVSATASARPSPGPIPAASPVALNSQPQPGSFPLADAAQKKLVQSSATVESPRVGTIHQDGQVELHAGVHDLEHWKGLPEGWDPEHMTCVQCGEKKNLHTVPEGYIACKTCPNHVVCCRDCFLRIDSGVEMPASPRKPSAVEDHGEASQPPERSSSPNPVSETQSSPPAPPSNASPAISHRSAPLPKSPPRSPPRSPQRAPSENSIRRGSGRMPDAVADISPSVIQEAPVNSCEWDSKNDIPKYGSELFPAWDKTSGTDPPTPPKTWCYYEQVNPDASARKHTYYVYKKRQISLETDADGTWFTMASKRQLKDGAPEKIHMSCIQKVGEDSPESCSLKKFKIRFFIRTANTKYVFLTITPIEREIWLQWFEFQHPHTRVEEDAISNRGSAF